MPKKIILSLIVLILLWLVAGFVRIKIFGRRANTLIQNTKPFERKGNTSQKILILGDSLAFGTGTSSPDKSVAGLVASRFPDATVINKAVNGKRTAQLATEVQNINENYDFILIIIGGNDILRPWLNLHTSAQNLQAIYSTASKHSSKVVALTTGDLKYTSFFLWPANYYFSARSVELRNSAKKIASSLPNVTYIDLVERNKHVKFDNLKESPDHLHLSDDGAKYWFEAILDSGVI